MPDPGCETTGDLRMKFGEDRDLSGVKQPFFSMGGLLCSLYGSCNSGGFLGPPGGMYLCMHVHSFYFNIKIPVPHLAPAKEDSRQITSHNQQNNTVP